MTTDFHMHIDAAVLPEEVAARLHEYGLIDNNFDGHPPGYQHFEPNRHLTTKPRSLAELREAFKKVCDYLKGTSFQGYVEAEFIPPRHRWNIPENIFDPFVGVSLPVMKWQELPPGGFRESEIHITVDRDRSDPTAIRALLEAGLFGAYLPKDGWTALILTAQGSKEAISRLHGHLRHYIAVSGGLVGKVKEERIVDFWISHPGAVRVPPVIG